MRTSVAVLLFLALAAPAPAAEPVQPREPADSAALRVGSLPWFEVAAPDAVAVTIRVTGRRAGSELPTVVGAGAAERQADGTFGWRPPASAVLTVRPGRYAWQAQATHLDGTVTRSAERTIEIRPPAGAERREPIPARLGRRLGGSFAVNPAGLPDEVGRDRFAYLTRLTARRWGLRATGWTTARPGVLDRRNVLGFAPALAPGVIGLTTIRLVKRWQRVMRCGRGGCVEVGRRYLGASVADRDVQLDARLPWAPGPEYPWPGEMDLESVLIHELAHFAGNRGHLQSQCANSPLVVYGSLGDWWRSPTDVFRDACQRRVVARAAGAAGRRMRFEHRTVVSEETTTVYLPTSAGAAR